MTTKSSRIDEDEVLAVVPDGSIDRVPGGAGDFRYHDSVLTNEPVHEARLTHVGLANHGHTDRVIGVIGVGGLGYGREHQIEQIARTLAGERAYRGGLSHAE